MGVSGRILISLFIAAAVLVAPQAPAFSFDSADLKKLTTSRACSDCDLTSANLSNLNLSYADLSGTILMKADLTNAILCNANLSKANLADAKLDGANLRGANLAKAYWINGKKCKKGSVGKCKHR
jgi:uncharacterized protein YjbI with pentapeptide repeats